MQDFLQNHHATGAVAALVEWLSQPCAAEHRYHALVDMSVLSSIELKLLERLSEHPSVALLSGSRYAAYGELGPRLIPLGETQNGTLQRMLETSDVKPGLSFVELRTSADQPVRDGLIWLAEASLADGSNLFCRYTDTRTLPEVLSVLADKQLARLGKTVRRWAWIGRDGQLSSWQLPVDEALATLDDTPIEFSNDQFTALMQAAECDTLYALLQEISPEIIPGPTPFGTYQRLNALLRIARDYGINDAPDQLQFVSIAWSSSEDFHRLSSLADTWQATRNHQTRFAEIIKQWPDALWEEIEALAIPADRLVPGSN